MHPDFLELELREQARNLDASLRRTYLRKAENRPPAPTDDVVLRLCCVGDDDALDRLAMLEGRPSPVGRHIVAEVGGAVVAALPLLGGAPLANPFEPTAHLLPLLELRARQLAPPETRRGPGLLAAFRNLSVARR